MNDIEKALESTSREEKIDALLQGFYNFSQTVDKDIGQLKEDLSELKTLKDDIKNLEKIIKEGINDLKEDVSQIKKELVYLNLETDGIIFFNKRLSS
ncbi:hypothetical protein [Natronospora cellulosivora (SeqCode)]